MGIDLYRLRKHNTHQANLSATGGDKEALVTLCVPRPRLKGVTLYAGGIEFDAQVEEWDYCQEEHVRAAPPEKELERAAAEGRLQNGAPSYYSRFYNDNQPTKKVACCAYRHLSFESRPVEEEAGGSNDITYKEPTPGAFRAQRALVHARHAKPHRTPIHTAEESRR